MSEKWSYAGDFIKSCNCDYGCPCNFNAPPTKGSCEGILALDIRDGKYGRTSLKKAKATMVTWWPGAIHQGNGVMQLYVDDEASEEQEEALTQILTGKAGKPWEILAKTFSITLPPKKAPIEMRVKGKETVLKVGKYVSVEAEPVLNPVTKAEHYADVVIDTYLVYNRGSVFSNKLHTVKEPAHEKLNWSHPGKNLEVAKVKHRGP